MSEDRTRTGVPIEALRDSESRPETVHFRLPEEPATGLSPQGQVATVAGDARPRTLESFTTAVAAIGYALLEKLGEGGMGVVWKARDVKLNRLVALKTIAGGGVDERAIIRFLAEAEAVASIHHPNVLQVFGYGEQDARPYMVLEFCPGGSLADRLKTRTPLKPQAAAELLQKIASGVAAAHNLGIVHRDLKPANILFNGDDEPKVADFGLAKRALGAELTRAGEVMGTPQYMAPEQAGGGAKFVGPPADVWALGVMLYECLGGIRPFHAESMDEILARVLASEAAPLRSIVPDLPRDLELICANALEKNAKDRYPTAGEFAADLGRFTRGEPISIRPLGLVTRGVRWVRRSPVLASSLAAVVFVTIGLVVSLASQSRQAEDNARIERAARESAERGRTEAEQLARENSDLARQKDEEAIRANEVSEFLAELFRSSDPLDVFGRDLAPPSYEQLRSRTARDFLDDADRRFRTGLERQPLVRAKLLSILGNSYRSLGVFDKARRLLTESRDLRTHHLPPDHPDCIASEIHMGQLENEVGNGLKAETHLDRAIELQKRIGVESRDISVTRFFLAAAKSLSGKSEALTIMKEELALREKLYDPDHRDVLQARIGVVAIMLDQGEFLPAVPHMTAIDASLRNQPHSQLRAMADVLATFQKGVMSTFLGGKAGPLREKMLLDATKQFDECLLKAESCLPKAHMYLSLIHFQRGLVFDMRGEMGSAAEDYRVSWEIARQTAGLAHPKALVLLEHYPYALVALKKPAEARALYHEVLKANIESYGEQNPWRTPALLMLAEFEAIQRDYAAAEQSAAAAISLLESGHIVRNKITVKAAVLAARELVNKGAPPSAAGKALRLLELVRAVAVDLHGESSDNMAEFRKLEVKVKARIKR